MSIAASDLKFYQSASMPENDTAASGGAINTAGAVEFTALAANDAVGVVSSSASDTSAKSIDVTGRNPAGAIVTENILLNGTTRRAGATTFERILKIVANGGMVGTLTIDRNTGGAVVATMPISNPPAIPSTVTSVRSVLYDSTADTIATVDRYELFYARNNHGSLTLNAAKVKLVADPSAKIKMALSTAKGDVASIANRLALPPSFPAFVEDGDSITDRTG